MTGKFTSQTKSKCNQLQRCSWVFYPFCPAMIPSSSWHWHSH